MKIFTPIIGAFVGAATIFAVTAAANASPTYVVHGIPGKDLGLDPDLPVDIAVNGECALPNVLFGQVSEPIDLPAGAYQVAVYLADEETPCTGSLAITARVDISVAETALIIAHLDLNGAPTVSDFTADGSPTDSHNGRIAVIHTAKAPTVDIEVALAGESRPVAEIDDLKPGQASFASELPPELYDIEVLPAGSHQPVAVISSFPIDSNISYAIFAIGSLTNETFGVIPVDIDTSS